MPADPLGLVPERSPNSRQPRASMHTSTPSLLQSATGAPATFFHYTAERSREFTSATTCSGLLADAVTRLPFVKVKVTEGPPVR